MLKQNELVLNGTEGHAMKTQCSICRHVRRGEIESALWNQESLRAIAREFQISKDAARRHRLHVPPQPDPHNIEIPACPYHGDVPHRLQKWEWVCGDCSPWDGRLAYWRMPGAPLAQDPEGLDCDEYPDKWVMVKT
jgi:hypothetical protein